MRKFAIFIVRNFSRIFYRHKVYGLKHLVSDGAIIAANHVSYLDPPLVGISCPSPCHFLARSSLFSYPIFGSLIRALGAHPVTKGKENTSAFKMALTYLKQGEKVILFPEGKRSTDGSLLKFEPGIGALALKAKVPIIPAYVHGTWQIWNASRKWPHLFGHTACVFGTALYFDQTEGMDKKAMQEKIAEEVMKKVQNLRVWYESGKEGTPP